MKPYAWMFAFAAVALGQVPHQHHPPSSDEYAKVLEDPSRDAWQKPHAVVMALDLKPRETVADIGAGTGYFARRFALHGLKVEGDPLGGDVAVHPMPPRFGMGAWRRLAERRFQRAGGLRAKIDLRLETDQGHCARREALNECSSFHLNPALSVMICAMCRGDAHRIRAKRLGSDWELAPAKPCTCSRVKGFSCTQAEQTPSPSPA